MDLAFPHNACYGVAYQTSHEAIEAWKTQEFHSVSTAAKRVGAFVFS